MFQSEEAGARRRLSLHPALRDAFQVTRCALSAFGDDNGPRLAAALAYYTLFALFPLLLLLISLIGFLLEAGWPVAVDAQEYVFNLVRQALPQAQELVINSVKAVQAARGRMGIVGLAVLLWSASNLFHQLDIALDTIWAGQARRSLRATAQRRLLSMGLVIIAGGLLLASTVVDTVLDLLTRYTYRLPGAALFWQIVPSIISAALVAFVFGLLYRLLPDVVVSWRQIWPGAVAGGVAWEVLKQGFSFYATRANWTAVYGPVAGFIALLTWLYLSAQVLLLGAEFSACYTRLLEGRRRPVSLDGAPAPQPGPLAPSEVVPATAEGNRAGFRRGTVIGVAGAAGFLTVAGLALATRHLLGRRGGRRGGKR